MSNAMLTAANPDDTTGADLASFLTLSMLIISSQWQQVPG
jgi:hypothetical protein